MLDQAGDLHFNRPYSYVLWTKQDYALFLSHVTSIHIDTRGDISPFIIHCMQCGGPKNLGTLIV